MARRKRQSNRIEICPRCYKQLVNRASAVSHFRAHARRGELDERHQGGRWEFRLIDEGPRAFMDNAVWWHKGFHRPSTLDVADPMKYARDKYLGNLWQRQGAKPKWN